MENERREMQTVRKETVETKEKPFQAVFSTRKLLATVQEEEPLVEGKPSRRDNGFRNDFPH